MYISKLSIRNFRNFRNSTFLFQKGVNTLIGENGSGKTNVFFAMRLLIDDNLPIRAARSLEEEDFNRQLSNWKGHWIIINLEFDELDPSEGSQVLAIHGIGLMDGSGKGTYTLYFRPKHAIRKKLFELSNRDDKDPKQLAAILRDITIDDYEAVFRCRATADFSDDVIYEKYIGDFDNIDFPDPDIKAEDILGSPLPEQLSIQKELSCTFVKALRDVVSDLRQNRNNPLINLLRTSLEKFSNAETQNIEGIVDSLNSAIGELPEIQKLSNSIRYTVKSTVGTTYSPRVDIKSDLPNDMEKLLRSLTLWVGDSNDGDYQGQVKELSLGGANLIFISLKLLEYELKKSGDKVAHFLLIEEPEAHIHTHIQMTLFEKYSYWNTQVFITTHSTHISAASKIRSVNILSKGVQEAKVFHPSVGLEETEIERIERYLDAVRSTLLFSKGVILVEGDAEQIVIPAMVKSVFGISLDEIGISLINMSSAVFTNIGMLFHDDRIRRRCAIVTDEDRSIVDLNNCEDEEFKNKCENSQKSGKIRKNNLDAFCSENQWIKPFYANHTFEVDFLLNGNAWEVVNCLQEIYPSNKSIREKSKKLLQSKDISTSGKEILRIADKVGKGWLALMLAEHFNTNTYIPDYILQAVAFSSEHLVDAHYLAMAEYRINNGVAEENKKLNIELSALIDMAKVDERKIPILLNKYKEELPRDQLTKFMGYMGESYV